MPVEAGYRAEYTGTLSDDKITFKVASDGGATRTCEGTVVADSNKVGVTSFAGSCTTETGEKCDFSGSPKKSVAAGEPGGQPIRAVCTATQDCSCEAGKTCAFNCQAGGTCKATCAAGSTCALDCQNANSCELICNGATCSQVCSCETKGCGCTGTATGSSSFAQKCTVGDCALTCDPSTTSCTQTENPFNKTTCTGCPVKDGGASQDAGK
jgi:hypothetical protein